MFAEVVLHRRVPQKIESFTYTVPNEMRPAPGQLVRVPFRRQLISGIVKELHEREPLYATRSIEELLPLCLSPKQFELAQWMAQRYSCNLGSVLHIFVPEKVWSFFGEQEVEAPSIKVKKENGVASHIRTLLKFQIEARRKTLIIEKTHLPRKEVLAAVSQLLPNTQCLFLYPEVFSAQHNENSLPSYHSELTEGARAHFWNRVRLAVTRHCAATRAGLFLPFKNLSAVVIDSAHSEEYQERRTPKYQALEVAEKICELHSIPLILLSNAPTAEMWREAELGSFEKIVWDDSSRRVRISITDMSSERRSGNFGLFAHSTIEKMAGCLARSEQVLLFVNRKGRARCLLCKECSRVVACPECSTALTVHVEDTLTCTRCRTRLPLPERCSYCNGVRLKPLGFGTEKIELEIKKLFGRAKVLRLDREVLRTKKSLLSALSAENLKTADIIVATSVIDKPLPLERVGLSVIFEPERVLHFPDFSATEHLLQILARLRDLTKPAGELVLQTLVPDYPLFTAFSQYDYAKIYHDELEVRKKLSLPPYSEDSSE